MRSAIGAFDSAGNVFDSIIKNIENQKQNEITSKLETDKALREEKTLQNKLLQDEDAANVAKAVNDSLLSSIDNRGNLNIESFRELTKGIIPQTSAGVTVLNNSIETALKQDQFMKQQELDKQGLDIQKQQAADTAAYHRESLAIQKAELEHKRDEENQKQLKEFTERDDKFNPKSTLEAIGIKGNADFNIKTEEAINSIFYNARNKNAPANALYGNLSNEYISKTLIANSKSTVPWSSFFNDSDREVTYDTLSQLNATADGAPSYITAQLVVTSIAKAKGANAMQVEFIKKNPEFFTMLPSDLIKNLASDNESNRNKALNSVKPPERKNVSDELNSINTGTYILGS